MGNRENITDHLELIYSPDDKGWYFQKYQDWKVSQLFSSHVEAMKEYHAETLVWTGSNKSQENKSQCQSQ